MIEKLGLQLYTIRDFLQNEEDVKRSFEKLAKIGYKEAQTAGLYAFMSPEAFAKAANDNGIEIIGTHVPFTEIEGNTDKMIEMHRTYGTTNMGIGGMPGLFDKVLTKDEVYDFIARFNACAKKLREKDMKLTYHNHHYEFLKVEGKPIMDHLIENLDKETVTFVLDTYWLQCGGVSILEYMNKLAGRVDILHLKDFKVQFKESQNYTEILNGTINFTDVIAAGEKIGVKHYVVEQDSCPGDPFDSLKTSYDNLKNAGLLK